MISRKERFEFETKHHKADICIVGGGVSGMLAAISAARLGSKVVLMQDRPVLGGNASSEVRMWIRGARGEDKKETGLIEEIALENIYRNPDMNFSVWDTILYEKVRFEENIDLILNCSCCDATMIGERIVAIKGWQTTTQRWHTVEAEIFSDCSGDSVLAPLTGAEFRIGREAASEFGESIAPEEGDLCTMGLSCLLQARETSKPVTFIPPKWAYKYKKEDFKNKINFNSKDSWIQDNFWWMEIGGMTDTIGDTEELRDELIKTAYGCWDFVKNSGELDSENWTIEWLGFLPGKRESRRYVGDYIMTQNDVASGGQFEDIIAYGGWSMDDHHPMGFQTTEPPTIHHKAPSPYGIPYRVLYSGNIENLMFAGRNISATHSAMSSTRVMATCGILGQAMGTAANLAVKYGCSPRGVYENHVNELQQSLMDQDCYLPYNTREGSHLMKNATIHASNDAAVLTDGIERKIDDVDHVYQGSLEEAITIELPECTHVNRMRLVFDSDLNRATWSDAKWMFKSFPMKCNVCLDDQPIRVPETLIKEYEIAISQDGENWTTICEENENHQRLMSHDIQAECKWIRLVPKKTWGSDFANIYAIDVD